MTSPASSLSQTSKMKPKTERRSKRKAVKGEYASLINKMEAKVCDLTTSDVCLGWLVDHLRQGRAGACFCKGFEAEVVAVRECRQICRDEVLCLKDEVDSFHNRCEDQMTLDKQEVSRHKKKCKRSVEKAKTQMEEIKKSLVSQKITEEELESDKMYLERKQRLLDREGELLEREDAIVRKRKQLEEFETEIEEIESMLNRRQTMCDRKHEDLITLHEELKELRTELDLSQDETSERAHRNWEILRRNLQERQKLLESNVQKYRTELASASATLTGKDIHISKMQEQITELNHVIEEKDQKIRQLESRLGLALAESLRAERGDFNHWRRVRGLARSDSCRDDSSAMSSTDDSANNSPARFSFRSTVQQRLRLQHNSVKTNSQNKLNNGSPQTREFHGDGWPEGTKFTKAIVHRNNHVNTNGTVTPVTEGKPNASSACTVM